ncbi:MAG: TIGR03915 family putative DNA repair protein [Treponema sp.]|nr:TIGR03915 family putative DNA repair protein [Treponema sp.]
MNSQGDLFAETEARPYRTVNETDIAIIAGLYADASIDLSVLPPNARRLFELSIDAFGAIVHAWMSELPITAAIIRFGQKVLAAADRHEANRITNDRGDPDVQTVREAAYKVWHEIHRLMGLLRFCPDANGVYIAHCEPDHCVLPAFGPHFTKRFGETPWAIIDVKRRLCLRRTPGNNTPELCSINDNALPQNPPDGEWGNLWRHYHKVINNESRHNPNVQKRFMPKRYWKYLNEV